MVHMEEPTMWIPSIRMFLLSMGRIIEGRSARAALRRSSSGTSSLRSRR